MNIHYIDRKYIFIVHSGITEIVASRIIERLSKDSNSLNSFYIFHPESYKPFLLKNIKSISFSSFPKYKNNKISKQNKSFKLKIKSRISYLLYQIRRASPVFGKAITSRIKILPISMKKIYFKSFPNIPIPNDLCEKHVSIFTPHVRLHIFQYIISFSKSYDYNLIEEGILSFKKLELVSPFYNIKISSIFTDFISLVIFKLIVIIRTILDFINFSRKEPMKSTKVLLQYIDLPIFSLSLFRLKNLPPKTLNKISLDAFKYYKETSSILYSERSYFEKKALEKIDNIICDYDEKKYNLLLLPGNSLEILSREFNPSLYSSYDLDYIIIRPHPRLSEYSIKFFVDLLSIKLPLKNIELSEKLRLAPLELLSSLENFKIILSRDPKKQLSSSSIYHN